MSETSKRMERCRALRADTTRHYNCAQATFVPVAESLGMDTETACRIAAHFAAGMGMGATCGGVTGGLMALGLAGADKRTAQEFLRRVRAAHDGALDCAELLRRDRALGHTERKPHCDAMVFACLALVEELLADQ